MTTLKDIFDKPIDRTIEGVIKADDEASLGLEIDEYVLTHEVARQLEDFLEAYNGCEGTNGAWISGFFGSGKSHLLKMLALLLENRPVDGTTALERFAPKCADNALLSASLKKAAAIPSKSILFNIDQKADVISKVEIDALLAVFVKVFDEMCGYYGKQGHIARFERDLDSRGQYQAFKAAYQSTAKQPWDQGREQSLLEAANIATAYAEATGSDAEAAQGILDKYRSEYRVSIEDFAEQVGAYIERQSSRKSQENFRLNFFVDEVGQYIADNVKLMTNLQTVAESLATRCRGRAWIVVTAQEEIESVVGEMDKQKGHDFSKIQARFANRMKLTSADVAEVIQERLLSKNAKGEQLLAGIHAGQSNSFRTLFDFADGSQNYRNFEDEAHFIRSYPFVAYQFPLFQAAIRNLSQHNAFEGRHRSVGERSMLSVFQQVVIRIADQAPGRLATFDLMFEGVRSTLKSGTQQAILQAERHLENPLAKRLLKALLLVKYIREFKSTPRNLRVLMLADFKQEIPTLREEVEQALQLLEQQTYARRIGDIYEYLTDEEKDIEREIKNTDVENSELAGELKDIAFDQVIRQRKIRIEENGHDYPFSKKLDGRLYDREHELAIHLVSPLSDLADSRDSLLLQSAGRPELLVVLPADDRLMRELLAYKRTEKYIRLNTSVTPNEAVKRVLQDKAHQNQQRHGELKALVQELMGRAELILAGASLDYAAGDAQTRVTKGFQDLVSGVYPHLRMLQGVRYTEQDIAGCLTPPRLIGNEATALEESEQELLSSINAKKQEGVRTTLKRLLEVFERKPYGWPYPAVLCTLAKLCARSRVEVRADGSLLEGDALASALRNTRAHVNVVLEPQARFSQSALRAIRELHEDFFDAPPGGSDARELGEATAEALRQMAEELYGLVRQAGAYPFLNALQPVADRLDSLCGKPYDWYIREMPPLRDELMELKEGAIAPALTFMRGAQKDIYDSGSEFVRTNEPNFSFLEGDEADRAVRISRVLADPECYKGNRMRQVKTDMEALGKSINAAIKHELGEAGRRVAALRERLCAQPEYAALSDGRKARLTAPFEEFPRSIENKPLIAVIRETARRFEEADYRSQLEQMAAWAKPDRVDEKGQKSETGTPVVVAAARLPVRFDKALLSDAADVESYVSALRDAMLNEINSGRRISV
ncbi:MAG: BREX system P-loop protein BrxC [Gammaproteobacteria bacterium]|nr:BREX system P-loop protein BrxC [Gammaproteobacteria bacterium]MDE0412703.1 BREX system P-loop protein BrxC [Gammaproteobacteria bacterium]